MSLPPGGVGTRSRGSGWIAVATAVTTATIAATVTASIAASRSSTAIASTAVHSTARATPLASGVRRALTAAAVATHVTSGSSTTSAASGAAATAATEAAALSSNALQEGRDLLIGFLEQLDQVTNNATVAAIEESGRNTGVSCTTSATDTVDVVVDIGRKIIVDNVLDVGNIQTTSCDSSGNQDGAAARAEHLQSTLTLALSTVSVDGGGREALVDQEIRQGIRHALRLHKDQGKTRAMSVKNVEQDRPFVNVLDVFDLLGDVLGGRTDTSNRKEDVLLQEVTGKHLNVAGESGRKHEGLTGLSRGHVLALYNATNLGLETHVQHAVSLVKNQVLDVLKRDTATLDQVNETARSSDEQITTTLDLAQLGANVGTAVDDAWAHPGAVSELASLIENLGDELTSWCKNEGGWVSLALASKTSLLWDCAGAVLEGL